MKKQIYITALLFITYFISPITFVLTDTTDDPLKLQLNIEAGVGIYGSVSKAIGKKDYNTVHVRPSFYIEKFGVGFDFKFRFRNYPGLFEYNKKDWDFSDDTAIEKLYKLSDMLNYTVYGSPSYFVYGKTGIVPYITAGNGLLINSLSNKAFAPSAKENGVYTRFDGNKLPAALPLACYFYMTDLADPDIFASGGDFDFGTLIPLDNFSLKFGTHLIADLDSAESNYLSAETVSKIGYYRNTEKSGTTAGFTIPIEAAYSMEQVRFRLYNEFSSIYKNSSQTDIANMTGIRVDTINLPNSGYLLGIPFSITVKTPGYYPGYFSSNYENVRIKQFTSNMDDRTLFFNYGLYLTALEDQFTLSFLLTSPFEMEYYTAIYDGVLQFKGIKNTTISNLEIVVNYRAAFSQMDIVGAGGSFFHSITKDFRFSFEINYTLYGTKLSFLTGVQSPYWVNSYQESFTNEVTGVSLDAMGNLMEKFMRLEVSFVL